MDGADATAVPLGAWASIRGYFTPATLFLVVNLVIGTIALTSRSHQRRRRGYHQDDAHQDQEPLHQLHHHTQRDEYHYYQQQYAPPPAPLARTSSVLDRLRSLGLYRFRSGDFPPEYTAAAASHTQDVISPVDDETKQSHYARSQSDPPPARQEKRAASRMKRSSSEVRKAEVARAPARVVEAAVEEEDDVVDARADEFVDNFTPQQQELHYQEEYVPPPAPAPLARTPSVLDRLRSFGLYRFRSGDLAPECAAAAAAAAAPTPAPDATTAAVDKKKQAAHYDRSRSEPAREQNKKEKRQAAAEAMMAKSSSELARKAPAAPSIVEEEGVDVRADNFINKFRQQLQLQRLNSLLNYKEMLNRGGKQ